MKVNQVYSILNTITKEQLGEQVIVNEDLSNVIEVGKTFENVIGFDNYVRALNDQIGKIIFVDRVYKGRVPSVFMDGWEFGSILEKVSATLPSAEENEEWELEDGASYDPNIFYKPSIQVSCWNNRVTFEIPVSITENQVKSSFTSPVQLNAFMSMIYTAVANALTVRYDGLISRTINNFIAETVYSDYSGDALTATSHVKSVNLLYLYNSTVNAGTDITADEAITNMDFLKFASYMMGNYVDRMQDISTLFNIGAKERFTPKDRLHVVLLSQFKNAANVYLQSDTFHQEFTALPESETVTFWQGSGEDYSFANNSKINVKTSNNNTVEVPGILGIMFDTYALGVTNMNPRVTTNYNPKAEFWNEWHKYDAGYFNDQNENMVVFFMA